MCSTHWPLSNSDVEYIQVSGSKVLAIVKNQSGAQSRTSTAVTTDNSLIGAKLGMKGERRLCCISCCCDWLAPPAGWTITSSRNSPHLAATTLRTPWSNCYRTMFSSRPRRAQRRLRHVGVSLIPSGTRHYSWSICASKLVSGKAIP